MERWIVNKIEQVVKVKGTCAKCDDIGRILNIERIFWVNLATGFHKVTRKIFCDSCLNEWTETELSFGDEI